MHPRLGALSTSTVGLLLNAVGAAARGFKGSGLGLEAAIFLTCLGIAPDAAVRWRDPGQAG